MTTVNLPFIDKYKPKTLQQIQGQSLALQELRTAVVSKNPALLYGPVGCGKTASIYALAHDMDYEIIEINASDVRNKEAINTIIGSSLHQMSLFAKGKIILVDEVDGIAGNSDRGGVPALVELISTAKQAIVMTANDPWDSKFTPLRKVSRLIEFVPIPPQTIVTSLQHICKQEQIQASEDLLKKIARKANGDLRSAILDLESIGRGKQQITAADVDVLDDRLREQTMSDALRLV